MEGTDIDARNAGAQASARTEKRGMFATLAAARVFAPMAVTGTGAPNAGARVFASTAGAKMLAGIVAPHNFLLLLTRMLWLLPLRMGSRALPLLSHSIWLFHECTAHHQQNVSFHIFIIVAVAKVLLWPPYTCAPVNGL